jgi:hypothetical protein
MRGSDLSCQDPLLPTSQRTERQILCLSEQSPLLWLERAAPYLTEHNASRMVLLGDQKKKKISKASAKNGHMVVDLNAGVWTPHASLARLRNCATRWTYRDTIVIDPRSNSAFLGTGRTANSAAGAAGRSPTLKVKKSVWVNKKSSFLRPTSITGEYLQKFCLSFRKKIYVRIVCTKILLDKATKITR